MPMKKTTKHTNPSSPTRSVGMGMDKISLVIPCYNEAERIPVLSGALQRFDKKWNAPYEVIVVDDGSNDGTAALARKALEGQLVNVSYFETIVLEKNKGKGGALQAGVKKATGGFILTLDADMATGPLQLLHWLEQVQGRRFSKNEILSETN